MKRFDIDVPAALPDESDADGLDLISLLPSIRRHWKGILVVAIAAGALAVGGSFLIKPTYIAENTFLPPQQQQSSQMSALASLGALSGLSLGGSAKGSPDEYVALLQSATVSDRIIKRFGLQKAWEQKYLVDTRKRLLTQVNITAGKKDSLMHIQVTDTDPMRGAQIANQYVEELRELNKTLAVTEAQQRRLFFERLLEQTRDKLAAAQSTLEASGYSAGALNSEPRSAAESYARTKAQLTAAQVKLQVMRTGLANGAPDVQSQQQLVNSLASELSKLEAQGQDASRSSDYVNRYREFKYQESLFQLFANQYESARVEESREGLIQVLDAATPAEKKSAPKRSLFAAVGVFLGLLIGAIYFIRRDRVRAA